MYFLPPFGKNLGLGTKPEHRIVPCEGSDFSVLLPVYLQTHLLR